MNIPEPLQEIPTSTRPIQIPIRQRILHTLNIYTHSGR